MNHYSLICLSYRWMKTLCQAIMVTTIPKLSDSENFRTILLVCNLILFSSVVLCADASEGYISVRYEVMELPVAFPFQKPPADKPNPKQGVGKLFLLRPNATLETAIGYSKFPSCF